MPRPVCVQIAGIEGRGRNKTEAKANALAKIEQALAGSFSPYLIVAHGAIVLIWRTPHTSWGYRILQPEPDEVLAESLSGCCLGYSSRDEAERAARKHLAQYIFTLDGPDGSEVIENEQDRQEHQSWVQWQRISHAWHQRGCPAEVCRQHADRGEWPEPDVLQNPAGCAITILKPATPKP